MSTTVTCRLSLVFARSAPFVVILRRGPTRWVEVIKWNTANDKFERGQWLHGRIYGERCGLSPNGKLFVYFAMKYGRVDKELGYEQTFTAVSKPPFLTALALWPEGSTWGGGGHFVDDGTLRLAYGANGTDHPGTGRTTICMAPMPGAHPNHLPHRLRIETDLDRYTPDLGFRDEASSTKRVWVGRDHNNWQIIARDGVLYRVNARKREVVLRDFNADLPERIAAPKMATVW